MTKMIATSILKYLSYIEDTEYLTAIVTSTSLEELYNIICGLLRADDFETFDLTCLFIRDMVLIGNRVPACKEFVESYPESAIVETLERLLLSDNHFIRRQTIYTLGKTCSYSSVEALSQAFNILRDVDPILLPRLIGEMGWLGAENFWELIEDMMTSQVYLTRWAVIEALSQFGDDAQAQDEMFQSKYQCFDRLRQDSNLLVRAEAEYEYQLLLIRRETHKLPEAERKKKRQELGRHQPVYFSTIESVFENYLYTNDLHQYSVDELEAFIEGMKCDRP